MKTKTIFLFAVWMFILVLLAGCQPQANVPQAPETSASPTSSQQAGLPNPASQNCGAQGGTLSIETREDGSQFGVCYFEDNRQCEEWALMRGDCPIGGLKVTGYLTAAARYCAITGGQYAIVSNSGAENEQGACTFQDGSQCDAWAYYYGKCSRGAVPVASPVPANPAGATIQPLTMEVCDGQAQAMAHFLDVVEVTQSEQPLSDPSSGATGTGCQGTVTGTGVQFPGPDAVVKVLGGMLSEQGWLEDPLLAAGGATGMGAGYRKDDQICIAAAMWQPDASANCLKDQPISACKVTPEQQLYTISLNCGVETAK